jgi:hypothetical protein
MYRVSLIAMSFPSQIRSSGCVNEKCACHGDRPATSWEMDCRSQATTHLEFKVGALREQQQEQQQQEPLARVADLRARLRRCTTETKMDCDFMDAAPFLQTTVDTLQINTDYESSPSVYQDERLVVRNLFEEACEGENAFKATWADSLIARGRGMFHDYTEDTDQGDAEQIEGWPRRWEEEEEEVFSKHEGGFWGHSSCSSSAQPMMDLVNDYEDERSKTAPRVSHRYDGLSMGAHSSWPYGEW